MRLETAELGRYLPLGPHTAPADSSNAHRVQMLMDEVDAAAAMMALAKISRDLETIERNKHNAVQAYRAAMGLILATSMAPESYRRVRGRLVMIREWLELVGLLKE